MQVVMIGDVQSSGFDSWSTYDCIAFFYLIMLLSIYLFIIACRRLLVIYLFIIACCRLLVIALFIIACCRLCVVTVPSVLKFCTEVIESHGVVDGIYRLSGIASNIQKLRSFFSPCYFNSEIFCDKLKCHLFD